MKKILLLALLGLLCACSTSPVMVTSFNGVHYTSAPTSANDPRLGNAGLGLGQSILFKSR